MANLLAQAAPVVDESTKTIGQHVTENVDRVYIAFKPIIDMLPSVLAMVVVLVVGFIVARVFRSLTTTLGEKLGLQHAAERSGLAASMKQVGIEKTLPSIVGQFVFWLLMCVFLSAAFNILNLPALTQIMDSVVQYIPRVLVATVLVVIGLLIAQFLRGVIATSADRLGLSYAERLATACYYVLVLMTFSAAFQHLKIEFALLNQVILIAFGALGIGFGLALGLGGRDVVAGILAGHYLRQRMQPGDWVNVAGLEGTVRDVGPVATVVETRDAGLTERHTVPNTKMLNEAVR